MRLLQINVLVLACFFVQLWGLHLAWADSLRLLETKPDAATQQDVPQVDKIVETPAIKLETPVIVEPLREETTTEPSPNAIPDNTDVQLQSPVIIAPAPEEKDIFLPRDSEKIVLPENTVVPLTPAVKDDQKGPAEEINKTPLDEKPLKQEIMPVIVQPQTQRPGRSIEDILADPMKNKQEAEKRDSLNLPDDTSKMDFLEGKWRCETDLINLETQEPIVMDFAFDKDGKGTARLKEKAGRIFSGSAKASFKNNILTIDVSKLKTPKSNASYNGSRIQCQQKGQTAVCKGKNVGEPAVDWNNATFRRVK